jgi:putative tricarboxylic transport membrane protein
MIVAISIFGVYAVQVSTNDLLLLLGCGVFGYFLSKNDYPIAPLVLGLVLGPMVENNLRRALTISNGDYSVFITRPISLAFLLITLLWLIVPFMLKRRGKDVVINLEG